MASGTIARLQRDKQFGFIKVDGDRSHDLFFHSSALLNCDFESLDVGQVVTFTERESSRGPRAEAVHVTSA